MCKALKINSESTDRIVKVLNVRTDQPTIDGRLYKYNVTSKIFDVLRNPESESLATVREKLDAYVELLGILCEKYVALDNSLEEIRASGSCASLGCEGEEDCLLKKAEEARDEIASLMDAVAEEETEFRQEAEKAAWGEDWTLRIDSPVGGWGVY